MKLLRKLEKLRSTKVGEINGFPKIKLSVRNEK